MGRQGTALRGSRGAMRQASQGERAGQRTLQIGPGGRLQGLGEPADVQQQQQQQEQQGIPEATEESSVASLQLVRAGAPAHAAPGDEGAGAAAAASAALLETDAEPASAAPATRLRHPPPALVQIWTGCTCCRMARRLCPSTWHNMA